ncbi:hypothetical protein CANCADRAFT_138944 [Tortispora caseinolytica NRRL Y-17796]|uniref:Uncharacterized protein n=1 Tax=Tortispora caseinolytica NRRL Y-17796 TaxID=767744 RepID=A0A1E4TC89_9ASCO|nr:hypothetical protein CANCADRAFT_138944 [Tortispora caseinolytica NRRL Y-17796]
MKISICFVAAVWLMCQVCEATLPVFYPINTYENKTAPFWRHIYSYKACNPNRQEFLLSPYYGFRGEIVRIYQHNATQTEMNLVHCFGGIITEKFTAPYDPTKGWDWDHFFCKDEVTGPCYKLTRKKEYAWRLWSLFVADSIVGGIFRCAGGKNNCSNENAEFMGPLVADDSEMGYFTLSKLWKGRVEHHLNMFSTPKPRRRSVIYPDKPDLKFAQKLDLFENYDYSDDPRGFVRKKWDHAIDMLGEVHERVLSMIHHNMTINGVLPRLI